MDQAGAINMKRDLVRELIERFDGLLLCGFISKGKLNVIDIDRVGSHTKSPGVTIPAGV